MQMAKLSLTDGNITLSAEVPHPIEKNTKRYLQILLRLMDKGLNNPAYQLNTLSLMLTGKTFLELVEKKQASETELSGLVEVIMKDIKTNNSESKTTTGTTVDDFLEGLTGGKGSKDGPN